MNLSPELKARLLVVAAVVAGGLAQLASGPPLEVSARDILPPRPPREPLAFQVFFSRSPESDDDFSIVFPVSRSAPDQAAAVAALRELIAGPTPEERDAGYFSELGGALQGPSDCAGDDFNLAVEYGTATLRFCRLVASAGIGQDGRTQSQIEATLRQFPEVQQVRVLSSDGHCLFDMSGMDLCLQPSSSTSIR